MNGYVSLVLYLDPSDDTFSNPKHAQQIPVLHYPSSLPGKERYMMWFLVLAVCERMRMQGNSCLRGLKSLCVLWRALCTATCKSYLSRVELILSRDCSVERRGYCKDSNIMFYLTDMNTHST